MKKSVVILLLAVFSVFMLGSFDQVEADTAEAEIEAQILEVIELENVENLSFGAMIPGDDEGTVTVASDGTVTAEDLAYQIGGQEALFAISPAPDEGELTFEVPLEATPIELEGPEDGLVVDNFEYVYDADGDLDIGDITVGAELTVPADQEPGLYTGDFEIEVEYQ